MGNSDWLQRSRAAVWHPCTQMKQHDTGALPLEPIARGAGAWLYGFEGQCYLDAISSWWVNLFGHANPRINAAIKDQLDRLEHVILAGFTHAPVVTATLGVASLGISLSATSVTATGCTIGGSSSYTGSVPVQWVAVRMTSASGTG